MSDDRKILCVGAAYIDVVNVVESYPEEDTDQRCLDYYWQRGGNASGSSTAISVLGLPVEFLGVLADDLESRWLRDDFKRSGVGIEHCVTSQIGRCPMTSTVSSLKTGSRTITFSERGLPELKFVDFDKIELESNAYKWIHFEGRPNVSEVERMFSKIEAHNKTVYPEHRITTSLEIEQTIFHQLENLVKRPDFVFFSKDWSRSHGLTNMEACAEHYSTKVKAGGAAIAPWADKGASAKETSGDVISIPAFSPERVIDTLGCGDTFVGSVVAALSTGKCLGDAVEFGCKVAGAKCGMKGVSELHRFKTLL